MDGWVGPPGSPPPVYHYCNIRTLRSIVENERSPLWLSNAFCLNDYREVRWGLERYRRIIELFRERDEMRKHRESLDAFDDEIREAGLYVAAFSSGDDLLSQWRAYADDGRGLCIGFDFQPEDSVLGNYPVWKVQKDISFSRVLYGEMHQAHMAAFVAGTAMRIFQPQMHISEAERLELLKSYLVAALASMKNPGFSEESEYRLIHCPLLGARLFDLPYDEGIRASKVLFRETPDRLIDYVEVSIPKTYFRSIVLGPACRAHETEVRKMLRANGFPDSIEIKPSKASYSS